jgi:penicillin amidase
MIGRILKIVGIVVLLAVLAGAGFLWRLHRRALPSYEGTVALQGLKAPVEILRDRWGVPHIFAQSDEDAYFAQGWATAQDRLFQIELTRRVVQGRLAEVVGKDALDMDKMHRTLDFSGYGKRKLAQSGPAARAAAVAYAKGVNAYVAALDGNLPIEFTLLGIGFAPLGFDETVGVVGYMAWGLLDAPRMEPLYQKLLAKLGPERTAALFPEAAGGRYPAYAGALPAPDLLLAGMKSAEGLGLSPVGAGSNNWVIGPKKSASGHAILANDPHLHLGLPAIWHEVHLSTPDMDVVGVTIPGVPFVTIGHNRDIAWGLTNLMLDSGDFFLERINPEHVDEVMFQGKWVKIEARKEVIPVKGGAPVELTVRTTPHGPLVNELLPGQTQALSLRWTYHVAQDANEVEGFMAINKAKNWADFRAGVARMGAVAQNFIYADRQGHIGMQAGGRVPVRKGPQDGARYRSGWDGSQEWTGFVPFDRMPSVYDPPQGWLASANTAPFAAPSPYYIATFYEPRDRLMRIREVLQSKDKLSLDDLRALQSDITFTAARELTPKIRAAFAAAPPADPTEQAALKLLDGWDGKMAADSAAAAVFAVFYRQLFPEIFSDEFGPDLTREIAQQGNLQGLLIRTVIEGGTQWLDRGDTPQVEGWPEVVRPAFGKAVAFLKNELGGEPSSWQWGRLHTFELMHPLGSVKLLAPYFNLGPYPVSGHSNTVAKRQFPQGTFHVNHGASMRQVTDFADLNTAVSVLPGGESGIVASPHYGDQFRLWLAGQHHALLLERAAIEKQLEGRQVLTPAP